MTIAEQINTLVPALRDWANANSGSVKIANDQEHVLDLLRLKPGAPMVAILFDTEDPRGDHDELGKVDRAFRLIISRGRGLRLETGESLTQRNADEKPMFDLLEELREILRRFRFAEEPDEPRPYYTGTGPFQIQGLILDAYEIRFQLGTQLPLATDDAQNDAPS